MGDILMTSPHCEDPSQYQSTTRTVLETLLITYLSRLLWVLVIAAYVPQLIGIRRAGTKGISPYYVLNHGLFSTTTLALRLSHSVFFPAFTCVASRQIWGWQGYSALLGFVEVAVQWLCSVILRAPSLVVYIRYRTMPVVTVPGPDEARARRMSDWLPEEAHAHKLTSTRMRFILGIYAAVTLPISLAFLFVGALPSSPEQVHHSAAYTMLWSIWITVLCAADAFLVVFQFIKQMKTVGRLGTRGSLSITSIAMQSVVLVLLSVSQFYRTRGNFSLHREHPQTFARFLALFFYVYGSGHPTLPKCIYTYDCVVCVADRRKRFPFLIGQAGEGAEVEGSVGRVRAPDLPRASQMGECCMQASLFRRWRCWLAGPPSFTLPASLEALSMFHSSAAALALDWLICQFAGPLAITFCARPERRRPSLLGRTGTHWDALGRMHCREMMARHVLHPKQFGFQLKLSNVKTVATCQNSH
ncbi:hypothetical protein PG985_000304 [Apiospora marii]|uniref:uncharacterized protein n=1 Tax=Apiospora marii TaxID=335849 RepID=UPI00312E678B